MEGVSLIPWDDLCKILHWDQWIARVQNGVGTVPKISTGWVGCTNVTDDRQTDGFATANGKNTAKLWSLLAVFCCFLQLLRLRSKSMSSRTRRYFLSADPGSTILCRTSVVYVNDKSLTAITTKQTPLSTGLSHRSVPFAEKHVDR